MKRTRWAGIAGFLIVGLAGAWWWEHSTRAPRELPVEQELELQEHLRQAKELLRNFEIERAVAELQSCLALDPDHVEALFHRARAAQFKDGNAAAEGWLVKIDRLRPDDPKVAALRMAMYSGPHSPTSDESRRRARAVLEKVYRGFLGVHDQLAEQYTVDGAQGLMGQYKMPSAGSATTLGVELDRAVEMLGQGLDLRVIEAWKALFEHTAGLASLRIFFAGSLYRGRQRSRETTFTDKPPAYSGFTLEVADQQFTQVIDQSALDSRECQLALYCLGDIAMRMGDYRSAAEKLTLFMAGRGLPQEWQERGAFLLGTVYYKDRRFPKAAALLEPYMQKKRDVQAGWLLHLMGRVPLPLREEPVTDLHRRELKFTECAADLGIAKIVGAGPSAWGDVDQDGDLDLFVGGCDTYSSLYRNDAGKFVDVSREAGLLDVASGFSSTLIDFDNDGDLDLYIGRNGWAGPAPNSLYRNDAGRFTEITQAAGLSCPHSTFVHSWADFNRDGWLDLYTANGISDRANNRMYFGRGDGTFEDVTQGSGLEEPVGTRTIGFAIGDYDRDGDADLFVGGYDTLNRLYRNRGDGRFEEVAKSAGVAVQGDIQNNYVSFFFDYDNDGWLDLLTTKQAPFIVTLLGSLRDDKPDVEQQLRYSPRLFKNRADGTFEDVTVRTGMHYPHGVMGANIGDVNNDGWFDVYFGTGGPDIYWLEMNTFLLNVHGQGFMDLTRFTGLGHIGKGHGVTFADPDVDGDLDLYAPQGGFEMGDLWPCAYYRNELGNHHHWLSIELVGTRSNKMGIGARVTVRAGELLVCQEMKGGGGFGSCNGTPLHFGLGAHALADSVEIDWPSGEKSRFLEVRADQQLRAVELGAEMQVR